VVEKRGSTSGKRAQRQHKRGKRQHMRGKRQQDKREVRQEHKRAVRQEHKRHQAITARDCLNHTRATQEVYLFIRHVQFLLPPLFHWEWEGGGERQQVEHSAPLVVLQVSAATRRLVRRGSRVRESEARQQLTHLPGTQKENARARETRRETERASGGVCLCVVCQVLAAGHARERRH
jgi:hypothetical protein